jgi:hypothetical protein
MELIIGAAILWIVPIFIANSQGNAKNRAGLAYGILLGWIGVLCLALLPPRLTDEDIRVAELERKLRVKHLEQQLRD